MKMVMNMTMFQLECFLSCASLLSFNKTAKVHYTSASTVTRHIASLENELGVKLFVRDTHKVALTEEGNQFFRCVLTIMSQMTEWRENLIAIGKLPPEEPCLCIASYTSDGMYRKLVDSIQAFPANWLSKPIKFVFPAEGRMVETVLEGGAQIGIDSAEMLKGYEKIFDTHLLHRSPFHLLVGKCHPLYTRDSVSVEELLSLYSSYDSFIPFGSGNLSLTGVPLRSAEDLRIVGEFTISRLSQIIPILGDPNKGPPVTDNMMMLLPQALELFVLSDLRPVQLEGEPITTDYVLFWHKEKPDPEMDKFLEMVDYDSSAVRP